MTHLDAVAGVTVLLFLGDLSPSLTQGHISNLYNYEVAEVHSVDSGEEFLHQLNITSKESLRLINEYKYIGVVEILVRPDLKSEFIMGIGKPFRIIEDERTDFSKVPELQDDFQELRGNVTSDRYMNFDEIESFMKTIGTKFPNKVSISSIGKSFHGEDITMATITDDVTEAEKHSRPIIFIESGIHAREWITTVTAVNLIDKLARSKSMTKHVEWRIIPVLNPDGFKHSWEVHRMWYKSRRNATTELCLGVNLNRNFDFMWNTEDSTSERCKDNFAGSRPFSEPETRALRDVILDVKDRIKGFVSLHSYGQMIMHPPGVGAHRVPKEKELIWKSISYKIQQSIKNVTGAVYSYGSVTEVLNYEASGISIDWVMLQTQNCVILALELPDKGEYMLKLPQDKIEPTVEEMWAAMQTLHNEVLHYNESDTLFILNSPTVAEFNATVVNKLEESVMVNTDVFFSDLSDTDNFGSDISDTDNVDNDHFDTDHFDTGNVDTDHFDTDHFDTGNVDTDIFETENDISEDQVSTPDLNVLDYWNGSEDNSIGIPSGLLQFINLNKI